MNLKLIAIAIIQMMVGFGPSYANMMELVSDFSTISDQKKFDQMFVDGIIDSLESLSLSQEEVKFIKTKFLSYVQEVYGSEKGAEQLFENSPSDFEDKYLQLFITVKKEIIEKRKKTSSQN